MLSYVGGGVGGGRDCQTLSAKSEKPSLWRFSFASLLCSDLQRHALKAAIFGNRNLQGTAPILTKIARNREEMAEGITDFSTMIAL